MAAKQLVCRGRRYSATSTTLRVCVCGLTSLEAGSLCGQHAVQGALVLWPLSGLSVCVHVEFCWLVVLTVIYVNETHAL